MVVLGLCSLIAGLLTIMLPETLGTHLIENIDEYDISAQNGKPFFDCWSKRTLECHLDSLKCKKNYDPEDERNKLQSPGI